MIENIQELLKLGGNSLKNVLLGIYGVLTGPKTFFSSVRDDSDEFIQASIFACFISILNLVIALPAERILRVNVESKSYLTFDTVLSYAFWFIAGSFYYAVAKVFRGHASYRKTVTTFLYLRAFQPLLVLVSIPFMVVTRGQMMEGRYFFTYAPVMRLLGTALSEQAVIVSKALMWCVIVYFFVASVTAFRVVHRVGRMRGFCIAFFGYAGYLIMEETLETPLMQLVWQAFKIEKG